MSVAALLTRTCTITHRTQTGAMGRYNVPEWEETSTSGVPYNRQQHSADEDLNEGEGQFADFNLFFLIDTDIDGSDVVTDEADGLTMEVVGPPARFEQTVATEHIEVQARATDQQESS